MSEFVVDWLLNSVFASVVFFGGYITSSYFLLNAPHGAMEAWNGRIRRLRAEISRDRVDLVGEESASYNIIAPIGPEDRKSLTSFLQHHESVQKAERRLAIIRRRSIFLLLSLLVGACFGALVSVPPLFGVDSPSARYPFLTVFLGLFSSLLIVGLLSWPQAAQWNELRDATPD